MLAIPFEGSKPIGKPSSMTDEQCSSLEVVAGVDFDGFPFFASYWIPNKEDLEALNSGRGIWLKIISNTHPPVALFTFDEKGEIN